MKKHLTYFLIFTVTIGFSQMPVTDATANASLVQQISQGAQKLKQGAESLKFLKDAKDAVEKVNNVLRDYQDLKEIYTMQQYMLENTTRNIKAFKATGLLTPSEMTDLYNNYNLLLDATSKTIEGLNAVVSDGILKMGDGERLQYIRQLKQDMSVSVAESQRISKKYWLFAETRALNQLFKKK